MSTQSGTGSRPGRGPADAAEPGPGAATPPRPGQPGPTSSGPTTPGPTPSDPGPPRPTLNRDGAEVLDLSRYPPFLLNAVSGAWIRETSAVYRRDFGFGIGEWRVLAMVAVAPDIRQSRICAELRMNKSAVSRALAQLTQMGLLDHGAEGAPRRRLWRLSPEGLRVHAEVMAIALDWERRMTAQIPAEEMEVFLKVMRRMLANLEDEARA